MELVHEGCLAVRSPERMDLQEVGVYAAAWELEGEGQSATYDEVGRVEGRAGHRCASA